MKDFAIYFTGFVVFVVVGAFLWQFAAAGSGPDVDGALSETVKTELATPLLISPAAASPVTTSPIPSATATENLVALTAISFSATETERVHRDTLEISRNNAKLADALNTKNAGDQTAVAATLTAQPSAGTATKAAESTEIAEAIAQRTANAEAPTQIIEIGQARAAAETAVPLAWGTVFAVICVGVLSLVLAGVAVGAIRRTPAPVIVDSRPQIIHAQRPHGTGIERIPPPPVDNYDSFVSWAGAVLAGETVAVDPWEDAKKFVGNYRKLHLWLVKNKLIMRHPQSGRAVLNEIGEQVLSSWLVANPLPYSQAIDKNAAPPSVCTESVHTDAEGEGEGGSGL